MPQSPWLHLLSTLSLTKSDKEWFYFMRAFVSGVRSTGELNYNFATKKKSIFFCLHWHVQGVSEMCY